MLLTGDLKKIEKKSKKKIFQFFPQAGTVEENTWHIEVLFAIFEP